MPARLDDEAAAVLAAGGVIPAHPLALTADLRMDERRQRALTRYYLAAGVDGIAVGVHTTQFEIHDPAVGLLRPVLELAAEQVAASGRRILMIAGACGPVDQAVAEAELARRLGYDAVLLSPVVPGANDDELLDRARAVAEVAPLMGFYLQRAVGGPVLSLDFWRAFAAIPNVVAIKIAPFDRYRTLDVVRAVVESGRHEEIALYTGNDDAIVADLLTSFDFAGPTGPTATRIVGGLLGQWAVWTHSAVRLFADVRTARAGKPEVLPDLLARSAAWTDANAAVFDAGHNFAGSIAGVHEVLRRQGLLAGTWCINPAERLSPGQAAELDRVARTHPWLADDDFVAAHRDEWLR